MQTVFVRWMANERSATCKIPRLQFAFSLYSIAYAGTRSNSEEALEKNSIGVERWSRLQSKGLNTKGDIKALQLPQISTSPTAESSCYPAYLRRSERHRPLGRPRGLRSGPSTCRSMPLKIIPNTLLLRLGCQQFVKNKQYCSNCTRGSGLKQECYNSISAHEN